MRISGKVTRCLALISAASLLLLFSNLISPLDTNPNRKPPNIRDEEIWKPGPRSPLIDKRITRSLEVYNLFAAITNQRNIRKLSYGHSNHSSCALNNEVYVHCQSLFANRFQNRARGDCNDQISDHVVFCLLPAWHVKGGITNDGTYTDVLGTVYTRHFLEYSANWAHQLFPDGTVQLPCEGNMDVSYALLGQVALEVLRAQNEGQKQFVMCVSGIGSGRELVWAQRVARIWHEEFGISLVRLVACGAEPNIVNFNHSMDMLRANGINVDDDCHHLLPHTGIGAVSSSTALVSDSGLGSSLEFGEPANAQQQHIQILTPQQFFEPFTVVDYWTIDLQGTSVFEAISNSFDVIGKKVKTIAVSDVDETGDLLQLEQLFQMKGWLCASGIPFRRKDPLLRGIRGGLNMNDGFLVWHNPGHIRDSVPLISAGPQRF